MRFAGHAIGIHTQVRQARSPAMVHPCPGERTIIRSTSQRERCQPVLSLGPGHHNGVSCRQHSSPQYSRQPYSVSRNGERTRTHPKSRRLVGGCFSRAVVWWLLRQCQPGTGGTYGNDVEWLTTPNSMGRCVVGQFPLSAIGDARPESDGAGRTDQHFPGNKLGPRRSNA